MISPLYVFLECQINIIDRLKFKPLKLSSNIISVNHDPLTRVPEPYMRGEIPSHTKSTNDDPIQWNSARFFLINQMANQTAGVINRVHPLHSSGT